jgi:hypothetical protein
VVTVDAKIFTLPEGLRIVILPEEEFQRVGTCGPYGRLRQSWAVLVSGPGCRLAFDVDTSAGAHVDAALSAVADALTDPALSRMVQEVAETL